jgi:hypothetical protein
MGKWMGAHRRQWIIENGEIPRGMHVLHTCDNAKCIQIKHLYLGTHKDNMKDMVERDRQPFGEASAMSTLRLHHAIQIKTELQEAKRGTVSALARRYGVSNATIRSIRDGRTWSKALRDVPIGS